MFETSSNSGVSAVVHPRLAVRLRDRRHAAVLTRRDDVARGAREVAHGDGRTGQRPARAATTAAGTVARFTDPLLLGPAASPGRAASIWAIAPPRRRGAARVRSISCTSGRRRIQAELALRVVARAPLHAPRRRRAAAPRSRARRGRCATRRRRRRASTSSAAPAATISLHARVDARVQRRPLHRQAEQQRRVAQPRRPQARLRRRSAPAPPPSRAARARAATRVRSRGVDRRPPPSGAALGELGVQRLGPARPRMRSSSALAHGRVGRRAQLEVGERRPGGRGRCRRPRSGAARRPARRRSRRGRARRTRRRRRSRAGSTNESRRCSSRACSAGRRRAGQRLQAAVDLERVGGHRQRVLAALAQPLGERERHRGLAHAGGAEQGNHVHDR